MSIDTIKLTKPIEDIYKSKIHKGDVSDYPLLERVIAYGIPSLAAVAATCLDRTSFDAHKHKTIGIPAAIGSYLLSQASVTYAKPYVESMDKGIVKSAADFFMKTVDNLNNVILYVPTYNILPKQGNFNEVFAFYVMPAMVQGIESDFSNFWNKKSYEGEVAGRVYTEAISAGIAVNAASMLKDKIKGAELEDNQTKLEVEEVIAKNNDASVASTFVEAALYPSIKKVLVGKKYESGELRDDFFRTVLKSELKGTGFLKSLDAKIKDTVFENMLLSFAATTGVQVVEDLFTLLEDPQMHPETTQTEAVHNMSDDL